MSELLEKLNSIRRREDEAGKRLIEATRMIIPLLEDHKLSNSAKPLKEALFQIDAARQDQQQLLSADPNETMSMLMGMLGKDGK